MSYSNSYLYDWAFSNLLKFLVKSFSSNVGTPVFVTMKEVVITKKTFNIKTHEVS